MWFDHEVHSLYGIQIFNDSKTPSGRVHIGSLRGVVLHDVLARASRIRGLDTRFLYGLDDMDPLDGLPPNANTALHQAMGKPLCFIDAPEGSEHTNLAEHYAADFLATFETLGVQAEIYRMSQRYRDGIMNDAIERILTQAEAVREIYAKISRSVRSKNWYPLQTICEKCGKIGSTRVYDFDGKEVSYTCEPKYTNWANGCGYQGKISPYNGKAKLVWKLEWVAKWYSFGVTFEGAGKDHCTKGGSREVANACMRKIFASEPPKNMPYEFFLVSGSKMSSSKGIGTSAADVVDLLPPSVLRFLMIQTQPKRTVNFATTETFFTKLFNDYDRLCLQAQNDDAQRQLATMIGVCDIPVHQPVSFSLVVALLQLPHLDLHKEIQARYNLTHEQQRDLNQRIHTAQTWLRYFARDDEKITLATQTPQSIALLSQTQKAFLQKLYAHLQNTNKLDDDSMQQLLFDCARLVPIVTKDAFAAIYRTFIDASKGPRAGSLLAWLDRNFVLQRLASITVDKYTMWVETGISLSAIIEKITNLEVNTIHIHTPPPQQNHSVLELTIKSKDGKIHVLRTTPLQTQDVAKEQQTCRQRLQEQGLLAH